MEDQTTVMVAIILWILLLEYGLKGVLSDFGARKLCHAGCGLGIMCLDSDTITARLFVWSVAASSIMMTWGLSPLPAFRFSRTEDVGVTAYLALVSLWFLYKLPAPVLAPVFFVVGKWGTHRLGDLNPAWIGRKTVLGSLGVFVVTFASITYPCSMWQRLLIAAAACGAEAVGGEYDNLALAAVVLIGWRATTPSITVSVGGDYWERLSGYEATHDAL